MNDMVDYFPICTLHNTRLVHGFPAHCPMASNDPCGAMLALKDKAFAMRNDARKVATMTMARVCEDCIAKNSGTAHVKFLRES